MTAAADDRETRLRRLRLRCWRRGVKELDLILGGYVDARGAALSAAQLAAFEALAAEADPDIFAWITGRASPPATHADAVGAVRAHLRLT